MSTISTDSSILAVEIITESRKSNLTSTSLTQTTSIQFQLPTNFDNPGDSYKLYGKNDDAAAALLAYSLIPEARWFPNYKGEARLLVLESISLSQVDNYGWWKAEATYKFDSNTGQGGGGGSPSGLTLPFVKIGFSIGNRSKLLLKSRSIKTDQCASVDARPLPDLTKNEIGVTEDAINGTEVAASGLLMNITAYYYPNSITLNFINSIASLFPGVNAQKFLGCEVGEVLLLGADGEATVGDVVPITYQVEIQRNVTNAPDPPFPNLTAQGHWHIDYLFVKSEDPDSMQIKESVQYRIVHEIYEQFDLSLLGFPVEPANYTTTTTTPDPGP